MTSARQLAQRVVDKLEEAAARSADAPAAPSLEEVLGVLRMHGVPKSAPPAPQRHLRLLRLRMRGLKTLHADSALPDDAGGGRGVEVDDLGGVAAPGPVEAEPAGQEDPTSEAEATTGAPQDEASRDQATVATAATGDGEGDAFDTTLHFAPGLTVITGPNFRGKTTILEVLTVMLRGSRRGLQKDVSRWLREVSLDIKVGAEVLGLRVSMRDGKVVAGLVLSGSQEALANADDAPTEQDGVMEIAAAHDEEQWASEVEQLMLDRLSLEPIETYTRVGGRAVGTLSAHGWKAYSFALYPPPGASSHLLADGTPGLASRLLDVFLDLPGATLRARLESASKYIEATDEARNAEAEATADNVKRRLADAEAELARALTAAEDAASVAVDTDLPQLRSDATAASRAHQRAARRLEEAAGQLEAARKERQQAQRELHRLEEGTAARVLLHALDPKSCPRCEAPVDQRRRDAEKEQHHCAVCTRPVEVADSEQQAERAAERRERAVLAMEAAEQVLGIHQQAHDTMKEREQQAGQALQAAQEAVQAADANDAQRELDLAQREAARAQGAVDALRSLAVPEPVTDPRLLVLNNAVAVLKADTEAAYDALHTELDDEITDLARRFGIANLDSASFKRNLNMRVAKGGAPAENFGEQTAGERLRLRYALLLALLRVGNRRGINAHPGLLLLDSLRAEEVQQEDAEQLAEALAELCAESDGPQILTTTEDAALPGRLSVVPATIGPSSDDGSLF
jgi:hypothetical protein